MGATTLVELYILQVHRHSPKGSEVMLLAMAIYLQERNNQAVFSQLLTSQIALQHQTLLRLRHITREHKTLQACRTHQQHCILRSKSQARNKILQFLQEQFQLEVPYRPYYKASSYLNVQLSMTQS